MTHDDARDEDPRLPVLFAARWYPSWDSPYRGIFVADLAATARRSGIDVEVASWETVVDDRTAPPPDGAPRTPAAWLARVADAGAVTPSSWGTPGVPVVRLPAMTRVVAATREPAHRVAAAQAETLLAWAASPAFRTPALVHAHTGLPDGVAAIALADRLGVPLVTTEHERASPTRLEDPAERAAYLRLLDDGRLLLAVSDTLRQRLAKVLEVDAERIGVFPNPIDLAPFVAASGTVRRDPDQLLWVGTRAVSKGTDTLLSAFASVRATRPSLRLRLIGRAQTQGEEDALRALAASLGIADAVAFDGPADRTGVAEAMAGAAAFVHPSPWETFGVVAAEALAARLPVAASPSGGVEEILGTDDRFGVVASDTSAPALAAAIESVLAHPTRFDTEAMVRTVADRYGADAVASRLRELYEDRIAAHAAVGGSSPRVPPLAAATPGGASAVQPDRAWPGLIVVASDHVARARVAALPPALLRGLAVVTFRDRSASGTDSVARDGWFEMDPDRAFRAARARAGGPLPPRSLPRRITRAALHPRGTLALRRLARERDAMASATLRADLAAVADRTTTSDGLDIVLLKARDADVVEPLLASGARIWPSTLRGLVDAWDAAGRPALAPPRAAGDTYDPARYWGRLHERGDLSTVGQSARSPELNRWLYRAMERNFRSFLRRHRVLEPPPSAAFDVGVGIGYWVRVWRSLGARRVDGCDLVPQAVEAASRAAVEAGVEGEFHVADLGVAGSLGGRTYDVVSCFNVLLHVTDDEAFRAALANIASIVAPGGRLILAEPILLDPAQERRYTVTAHSRARPLAAYRDPLVAAGLELVALEKATVLANNPNEATSPAAYRRFERWWRFVVARDRAGARWIGPVVAAGDRIAMRTRLAPTTKFALFVRPAATGADHAGPRSAADRRGPR